MGLASYKLSQVWWQLYCVLLDCRQLYFAPSPLRRQTATASAEMISNRFSKMSVARLLPYIISLKWRGKKREQIHKSITTAHFTRWKDRELSVRACVWACARVYVCVGGGVEDLQRTVMGCAQSCLSYLPLALKDGKAMKVSWHCFKNEQRLINLHPTLLPLQWIV